MWYQMQDSGSMRLQAAMEYLSTYGWAILMLAVVLGVLYFLGVFNGFAQAPRLQPGACYVDRPNGPNTNQFIALEGTCTGEQPKFVTKFNGQNSYVIANNVQTGSQFTISLWVYATSYPSSYTRILSLDKYSSPNQGWIFLGSSSGTAAYMAMFTQSGSEFDSGFANVNLNVWENYIITYNGLTPIIYTDGVASAPDTSGSYAPATGLPLIIGGGDSNNPDSFFSGMISNVQIYNVSLSANDAESLYAEGIGGVPQDLQNLVAWLPLNGNSNDYGGNQYSGSPVNVIYTDTWADTFSVPSAITTPITVSSCYQLTLSTSGSGTLSANIPESSGCSSGNYISGQQLTLTATAGSGYTFNSWSGSFSCSNSQTTCSVTMPSTSASETAAFSVTPPTCYQLTLSTSGSGTLSANIPESSGCSSGNYISGQQLTLTATAGSGYTFNSWSGSFSCSNSQSTCGVTMPSGSASETATFTSTPILCTNTIYTDYTLASIPNTATISYTLYGGGGGGSAGTYYGNGESSTPATGSYAFDAGSTLTLYVGGGGGGGGSYFDGGGGGSGYYGGAGGVGDCSGQGTGGGGGGGSTALLDGTSLIASSSGGNGGGTYGGGGGTGSGPGQPRYSGSDGGNPGSGNNGGAGSDCLGYEGSGGTGATGGAGIVGGGGGGFGGGGGGGVSGDSGSDNSGAGSGGSSGGNGGAGTAYNGYTGTAGGVGSLSGTSSNYGAGGASGSTTSYENGGSGGNGGIAILQWTSTWGSCSISSI